MVNIEGLIFLLLIIAACVGLIMLQIKLSKKEAKMPGLILPIISFVIALGMILSYVVYVFDNDSFVSESDSQEYYEEIEEYTSDSDADESYGYIESIEETHEEIEGAPIAIFIVFEFIMYFMPTVVFLVIYFVCHPRKKAELDKMSISDME